MTRPLACADVRLSATVGSAACATDDGSAACATDGGGGGGGGARAVCAGALAISLAQLPPGHTTSNGWLMYELSVAPTRSGACSSGLGFGLRFGLGLGLWLGLGLTGGMPCAHGSVRSK